MDEVRRHRDGEALVSVSANPHTSKNPALWEKALFTLLVAAVVLPVGAQAILSGFFLIWFVARRAWRVLGQLAPHKEGAVRPRFWTRLRVSFPEFSWFALGSLALAVGIAVSFIIATATLGPVKSWGSDAGKIFRLWGKQGLYGLLMIVAMLAAKARGWRLAPALPWVAGIMGLSAVYMLAQRYTGVDWVHGWNARIPEHRFANGVFRPAGMMSHPLSMAYNNMVIGLMAYAFAFRSRTWDDTARRWWGVIFAANVAMLLLTGSRWPLLVLVIVIAAAEAPRLKRFWVWGLVGVAVAALGLWAEGTLLARFLEPFQGTGPWVERIPRLAFWDVHWRMFLDHPFAGMGVLRADVDRKLYFEALGYGGMKEKYAAHNIFLQTLADMGFIGFVALLAFMYATWRGAEAVWRGRRDGALFLVLAGLWLGGLLQNDFRDHEVLYAFWMAVTLAFWHRLPVPDERNA